MPSELSFSSRYSCFGFRASCFGFPAEGRHIGFVFSTPRAGLGANRDWLCLALNWLCFLAAQNHKNPHISLSYRYLNSFCPFGNWLCFFKLTTKKHELTPDLLSFLPFFFYFFPFSILNSTYHIPHTKYDIRIR